MSKSTHSHNKGFLYFSAVSLVLGAGALVGLGVSLEQYVHARAKLVADLSAKKSIDPVIGYQAAQIMDPSSSQYNNALAAIYIQRWEPQKALESLDKHKGGDSDDLLRSKALMELKKPQEAAGISADNETQALQQAMAGMAASGEVGFHVKTLVKTEGAIAKLKRIEDGGVGLAQEMITADMPLSAITTLEATETASTEKHLLIAKILLLKPQLGQADLNQAKESLLAGLRLNPANIALREVLVTVYAKLEQPDLAKQQQNQVQRLRTGQF